MGDNSAERALLLPLEEEVEEERLLWELRGWIVVEVGAEAGTEDANACAEEEISVSLSSGGFPGAFNPRGDADGPSIVKDAQQISLQLNLQSSLLV